MNLGKIFGAGIVGLLLTYMAYLVCDTLFTGTDAVSTMLVLVIPLAFGFGTIMYVITNAFKAS